MRMIILYTWYSMLTYEDGHADAHLMVDPQALSAMQQPNMRRGVLTAGQLEQR